jgi:hypothetical protein
MFGTAGTDWLRSKFHIYGLKRFPDPVKAKQQLETTRYRVS